MTDMTWLNMPNNLTGLITSLIGEKSTFDQVWSSLIKFDPFWTDLIQSDPKTVDHVYSHDKCDNFL